MRSSVDRSSPLPLYYQLQEALKQEMEGGRWKPGELLPSEAEMTAMFRVSRSVTRKALDILEADGQVYRIKGKGTVVAQPKFRYEAVAMAAEWTDTGDMDLNLSKLVGAQRVSVGGHAGRLLDQAPGDDVFELMFVESVGDVPACFTQMFLRPEATPALAEVELPELVEGDAEALVQFRDRYGLSLTESHLSIETTRANTFEADLLDIEGGSPVFLVAALDVGPENKPVAFSRSIMRTDHIRFSVVTRHPRSSLARRGDGRSGDSRARVQVSGIPSPGLDRLVAAEVFASRGG
ncbi:MAG TPA: GntR family transcriptional regulator [Thermoleophilaceae bacterium]|nr:GntR family transcriptional regulator [Thermoleophilaceae bacterium]